MVEALTYYAIAAVIFAGVVLGFVAHDPELRRGTGGLETVATCLLLGAIWPLLIVACVTIAIIDKARGK